MIRTVPSLKRKARADVNGTAEKVVLDRVFGITTCSNSAFASHPESGLLAYPAGCVIVIVDVKRNKQTHLTNGSKKTVVSLSFCSDGKHIASGESGHAPAVRVWDIETGQQVAELTDHKFSVPCVAFSPNQKYLFSIGNQFDNMINVWNWRTGIKVASNKNTQKVNALCFSPDSSHAVSVGIRHVRFWYLQLPQKVPGAAPAEAVPLTGKIAPLGDLQNNNFACAVYPTDRSLVVVTHSGILCQFNADNRQLQNSCTIKTKRAYCLAASFDDGLLYVGCANGTIRVFNGSTLDYVGMLPRPHKLGVDLRARVDDTSYVYGDEPDTQVCADTIALVWLGEGRVAATYSDHSVYVWNVADLDRVTKAASWLFHSSKIWGLDVFPPDAEQALVPADSFITCSGDDTIRIWNFADSSNPSQTPTANTFRNPFTKELLKIIYVDSNFTNLCDNESLSNAGIGVSGGPEAIGAAAGAGATPGSSFIPFGPTSSSSSVASTPSSANAPPLPPDNRGVRCVTVSPDGRHLCAGLRVGNIHIYDLNTFDMVLKVEAHDGEILALEYSRNIDGPQLLASGGRDRIVHVLDATRDYAIHQTFDTDHSSSITALKFSQKMTTPVQAPNGSTNGSSSGEEKLQMLLMSCSADKSILIRSADVSVSQTGAMSVGQFSLSNNVGNKSTLYDMETEPTQRFVAVACQDRLIRVVSIATGKLRCKYRGSPADDGQLVRFSLDPTGSLFAAACSDKTVSIVDFYTGELLATVSGHSEQITGVKFLPDLKRFVTVSADSCIFVWRLSNDLIKLLSTRLEELKQGIFRPLSLKAPTNTAQPPAKKLGATRSTSVEEQLSSLAGNNINSNNNISSVSSSSASTSSSVCPPNMLRKSVFGGSGAVVAAASPVNEIVNGGRHSATEKPTAFDQLPEWALKQLKETSVDDPSPAPTTRPLSTRARWDDRRAVNGGPLIIKTDQEHSHIGIEVFPQKTAWVSLDDDEEIVDDDDDIVVTGAGVSLMGAGSGVGGNSLNQVSTNNWLSASKITSPPKSANRLWSHLPAAGPSSPRQSLVDEQMSSPTPPIDEEGAQHSSNMSATLPIGRSPVGHSALSSKVSANTPPPVPLKKLLEQQQQQHFAANKLRSAVDDPSVFKKPAPIEGPVPIRPNSIVRRSKTSTDLAAVVTSNGHQENGHSVPPKSSTISNFNKPPAKIPAFMQPTMSSAAKNSRMPRSSSSSTIATIAQVNAMNSTDHPPSGLVRHSATAASNIHPTPGHRPTPQKTMFQSTPDLSSTQSASAAIASSIFSETDTDPEDNASSVGGDLHDRMISLPRSPAERKAYAMRAMRHNRNRCGSEGAIAAPVGVKVSISATFDDDEEEEQDSGVQQDSGRSVSSVKSPATLIASPSPQPVTATLSPMDLERALAAVQTNKLSTLTLPGNQLGTDVGQFKSKVLANVMLRATSPALSSDSSSTANTSSSESPGDILRRELEREKRAMRASPLASPQNSTSTNFVSTAPPPIAPKPSSTNVHQLVSSPLRRVPIVGIVHPSNPTTTTIPADPAQSPLVRLIESSSSFSVTANGGDDFLKNVKAVTVIPEQNENVTPETNNLHPSALMSQSPVTESPVSTRSVTNRRPTPGPMGMPQTPPQVVANGSPHSSISGGTGSANKRPSVVLISNLRRTINSPSAASTTSTTNTNTTPSPGQQHQVVVTMKSSPLPGAPHPVAENASRPPPTRHDTNGDRARDRSVSVENLSLLSFSKTNGQRSALPLADNIEEIPLHETSSLTRNGQMVMTNGTVSEIGSSMQQRKLAFSSMSVADLRNLPSSRNNNTSSSGNSSSTTNGHRNGLDQAEEMEHMEDLVKAWQGLTSRVVGEFERLQSVSRIERSISEERCRKRLLQVMLEARRQFDRCQEKASEDLFN